MIFPEGDSCTRHDGQPGICKKLETCEWARVNHIRPNLLQICTFEGHSSIVCCGDSTKPQTTPNTTPLNCNGDLLNPDDLERCIESAKGTAATPIGNRADLHCKKMIEKRRDSGLPLSFHIYGGTIVELGEYPSFAALGYASEEVGQDVEFKCGGILITTRHVLTAAHCMFPEFPSVVRLGTVDLRGDTYQQIAVARVEKHPAFKPASKINDIAIVILEASSDISDPSVVFPACLDSSKDLPKSGQNTTVVGFGKTEYSE